ncbi:hypothetical protein PFMG_04160 [Plasmodium falciparum IGH-CR14]|uniref:Uncharacterized protein n=1 Tax=Plasmodium falciparum IGH-CR14 TaxID=580059 RepID=A0A0L1IFU1_PLAFA|nr:hypothetical protein PFMG_04160 [Plasmodium falciparum IGH-CR14]
MQGIFGCNWNGGNLKPSQSNNWRASLVPAAALRLIGVAWGHSYSDVRGEILRFSGDEQLRKHLSKILPLIKNES